MLGSCFTCEVKKGSGSVKSRDLNKDRKRAIVYCGIDCNVELKNYTQNLIFKIPPKIPKYQKTSIYDDMKAIMKRVSKPLQHTLL